MTELLYLVGCLLLPFSTAPEDGVVFSFGIPFFALFVIALYTRIFSSRVVNYSAIIVVPFFMLIIMGISIGFSPNILQSLSRWSVNVLGFLLFCGILISIQNKVLSFAVFEMGVVVFGVLLSIYYLGNMAYNSLVFGAEQVVVERYVGGLASIAWGASNNISAVLIFSLATALAAHVRNEKRAFLSASFVISLCILATFSRTGYVLMLLIYLARMMMLKRNPIPIVLLTVLAMVLAYGLVDYWREVDYESFERMFFDRFDQDNLITGNGRIDLWASRLEYFLNNPFQPIGYYGSLQVFDGVTAHNAYITLLLEQSILGLIVGAGFLVVPLYKAIALGVNEAYTKSARLYLVGLVAIMINLFFEDANFTHQYILMLWIYMAIVYGMTSSGIRTPLWRHT